MSYPLFWGYDYIPHSTYATDLVYNGFIPGPNIMGTESHTPPLFYALAGTMVRFSRWLGASQDDSWRYGAGLNILWALGTAIFTLLAARVVIPGRRAAQLAALGFLVTVPVVLKTTVMFHPETLGMFLCAAVAYVAVRTFAQERVTLRAAALLGACLGVAQLARVFTIWALLAVLCVFAYAIAKRVQPRRPTVKALGVMLLAFLVFAGPWYVRQTIKFGDPLNNQGKFYGLGAALGRVPLGTAAVSPFANAGGFRLAASSPTPQGDQWSRVTWFYRPDIRYQLSPGVPQVFTKPYRTNLRRKMFPTFYAELWGDYFGAFSWTPMIAYPDKQQNRQLQEQSVIGVVPSLITLFGLTVVVVATVRRRERRLVHLLIVAGCAISCAAFAYRGLRAVNSDGDVFKATYMLSVAPLWALCFGIGFGKVARHPLATMALGVFLLGSIVIDLGFLIYNSPLQGVF